jgi:hypothetical protein
VVGTAKFLMTPWMLRCEQLNCPSQPIQPVNLSEAAPLLKYSRQSKAVLVEPAPLLQVVAFEGAEIEEVHAVFVNVRRSQPLVIAKDGLQLLPPSPPGV